MAHNSAHYPLQFPMFYVNLMGWRATNCGLPIYTSDSEPWLYFGVANQVSKPGE